MDIVESLVVCGRIAALPNLESGELGSRRRVMKPTAPRAGDLRFSNNQVRAARQAALLFHGDLLDGRFPSQHYG